MAAPTPYSSSPTTVYAIDGNLSTDIKTFLNGIKWGSGGIGTGATVYYSFPTSNSTSLWDQGDGAYLYAPNYEIYSGFRGLTTTQQTIASTILQNWANVANINLSYVATETPSEVGDIRIAFTSDGFMTRQDYAYTYFPEFSYGGDIWINATQPVASGNNYNPGGNGYHTILHEAGHAFGLEHSFGGFYTLSNTNYDSFKYSVMSYSDAPLHQDRGNSSFYPTTPMLLDIQAMQYLYGANMSYNAGDDVYVFNGASTYYQTIWDAGGTDTIQYVSTTGGIINLEAGNFSVLGKAIKLDKGIMQSDNVAIAYNVTIENAIGGDGHDTLYGNSVANNLQGGNGNDSLYGQASNDTLNGDAGNDYLDGGADKDTMLGGAGDDVYIVDNLDDVVLETLTLAQSGGVDLVKSSVDFILGDNLDNLMLTDGSANGGLVNLNGTGNALNNFIIGNAGNNTLDGKAGSDSLSGGLGNDTYIVDLALSSSAAPAVTPSTPTTTVGKLKIFSQPTPAPTTPTPVTPGVQLEDTVTESLNAGNDTLQVRGNLDIAQAATLVLSANVEVLDASNTGTTKLNLTGNALDNTVLGNAADNVLDGGSGIDTLVGGDGNDTYWVDIVASGAAPNSIAVLQDSAVENANAGTADALKLRGIVTLTNATLVSLSNTLAEFEQLDVSATGTTKLNLEGNATNNVLIGNAADNVISGGEGNDTLDGGLGNDILNGGVGDDLLTAGTGNDQLNGGDGNDVLIGSVGNDVLTGGLGADTFKWELADKGTFRSASVDQITDFNVNENDVLDLRDLLTGESITNLLTYLDITSNGINTEIGISTRGGFTNGSFSSSAENNHITLLNVDLFAATNTNSEADLLQQLINTNKLVIDT